MHKICSKCKQDLEISQFNWKITDKTRASYCKNCSREYIRKHYKNNREYYLKKARKRNKKIQDESFKYIKAYLQKHPCIDCGEQDLVVLEFDHKDKNMKKTEVSRIIKNTGSLKKLIEEISKCDVRCANCHRRKTAKEYNHWKLTLAPVA